MKLTFRPSPVPVGCDSCHVDNEWCVHWSREIHSSSALCARRPVICFADGRAHSCLLAWQTGARKMSSWRAVLLMLIISSQSIVEITRESSSAIAFQSNLLISWEHKCWVIKLKQIVFFILLSAGIPAASEQWTGTAINYIVVMNVYKRFLNLKQNNKIRVYKPFFLWKWFNIFLHKNWKIKFTTDKIITSTLLTPDQCKNSNMLKKHHSVNVNTSKTSKKKVMSFIVVYKHLSFLIKTCLQAFVFPDVCTSKFMKTANRNAVSWFPVYTPVSSLPP